MSNERQGFFDGVNQASSNTPKTPETTGLGWAIRRHWQFSDLHNGSWYIEIVAGPSPALFFVQEVRNGQVVRRTRDAKSFGECNKLLMTRAHRMSIEAGLESLPPPVPRIDWK